MWRPLDLPLTGEKPFTDYSRWRLLVNDGGRHTWEYLRTDEEIERWPQTDLDKFWLGLKMVFLYLLFNLTNSMQYNRMYRNCLSHRMHSKQLGMAIASINTSKLMTVTGLENMEDLCF